ncbi:LysR family substrate-binding domain-containing protein [Ancylobacter lacus]|nr:LysR family substrate-binding domain-containing protein [Ancylobacter lacus]
MELDLAIVMGATEWQGCDTKHLWSEQLFVALWNDHPKSRHRKLSWPDIVSEIFIIGEAAQGREFLDRLRERLKTFAEVPMIDTQNVGSDNLLSLVALGHGLTLVNETRAVFPFPGVVFRPVQDETIPFSAVWSPSNDNPALRRLISMAKFLSRNVAAPAKTSES